MKQKKAFFLPLTFLLSLLVAALVLAVVLVPSCSFGKKLFRLSGQAQESFDELHKKILDVYSGEEGDSVLMKVDKDTAIVGFSKDSGQVYLIEGDYQEGALCDVGSAQQKAVWAGFVKPAECEGKSCVCLCKELVEARYICSDDSDYKCSELKYESFSQFYCGNADCKPVDFDFSSACNLKTLTSVGSKCFNCEGGFAVPRGGTAKVFLSSGFTQDAYFSELGRERLVYVHEYKGKIAVCENAVNKRCI
jgi:hypothetical protein